MSRPSQATAPAAVVTDRARALAWIAHGLHASDVPAERAAPAMRQLEAEGWTPAAARDALAAAGDEAAAALRRGPWGKFAGAS